MWLFCKELHRSRVVMSLAQIPRKRSWLVRPLDLTVGSWLSAYTFDLSITVWVQTVLCVSHMMLGLLVITYYLL